jgi:hypothetical protein
MASDGATHLKHLIDAVDECWSRSIGLVDGRRPHPDFSVGFRRSTFTSEELQKLEPYIGDWSATSRLAATFGMHFPFLTAEVKCGNESIEIADRQNAHSASVAVNAIVELFRTVSRQDELHRIILAISISHTDTAVRIYGHYPLIDGKNTSFHRHQVDDFNFSGRGGRDKWTAYMFTRNVYELFCPLHLDRIRSAIKDLPDPAGYSVKPLSQISSAEQAVC